MLSFILAITDKDCHFAATVSVDVRRNAVKAAQSAKLKKRKLSTWHFRGAPWNAKTGKMPRISLVVTGQGCTAPRCVKATTERSHGDSVLWSYSKAGIYLAEPLGCPEVCLSIARYLSSACLIVPILAPNLFMVSNHSSSSTLSNTMPPPACKYATPFL